MAAAARGAAMRAVVTSAGTALARAEAEAEAEAARAGRDGKQGDKVITTR